MNRKFQWQAIFALLGVVSAPALADINVGAILSLTGPVAALGLAEKRSMEIWPTEIAGHKVNVTMLDDASDPTTASNLARKLVEDGKVDVIVGPSSTPTALAAMQIAGAAGTPMMTFAGGGAIISPPEGPRRWVFKMPPSEDIQSKLVLESMRKNGRKTLAMVVVNNPYGQTFVESVTRLAPQFGVTMTTVEKFSPTDASTAPQVLKILGNRPDATMIVAVGTPGATPHIELKKRGYTGQIYQTQAIAVAEFLRVGGKDVEGALLPASPFLVAEQLPDSNPIKQTALGYLKLYEAKYSGEPRSLLGALAWDAHLFLVNSVPVALRTAKPGTPAFRTALRDALEQSKDLVVTQGVYTLSATDHNGADERSQVLVRIENGGWRYAN